MEDFIATGSFWHIQPTIVHSGVHSTTVTTTTATATTTATTTAAEFVLSSNYAHSTTQFP